jgi:hypothetical protein
VATWDWKAWPAVPVMLAPATVRTVGDTAAVAPAVARSPLVPETVTVTG